MWSGQLAFVSAFLVVLISTPVVRAVAVRFGVLDQPGARKGHARSTPLLGGVAIALGVLGGTVAAALVAAAADSPAAPQISPGLAYCGAALIFAAGLIDDLYTMKPLTKLAFQSAAAVLAVLALLAQTRPLWSLFLFVGILVFVTNAFNLLDNMDGLSALCATISGLGLAALTAADLPATLAALSIAGAAVGFMVYNRPPASIFMGDAGSLFLGYSLAVLGLYSVAWPGSLLVEGGVSIRAAAVLFLFVVPLLDTTLVTVSRLRRGKNPMTTPGQDHVSHRLRNRGLSSLGVLLAIAAVGIVSALIGIAIEHGAVAARPAVATLAVALVIALIVLEQPRFFDGPEERTS